KVLVEANHARARALLAAHQGALRALAGELKTREVMDGRELKERIRRFTAEGAEAAGEHQPTEVAAPPPTRTVLMCPHTLLDQPRGTRGDEPNAAVRRPRREGGARDRTGCAPGSTHPPPSEHADPVVVASEESFPASDPPAWI